MENKRKDAGIVTLSVVAVEVSRSTEALRQAIDKGYLAATYFPPGRPFMGAGIWMTTREAVKNYLEIRDSRGIIETKDTEEG